MDNIEERFKRLCEEVGELGSALSLNKQDALNSIEYGFNKNQGEIHQELGGVGMCLFSLAHSVNESLGSVVVNELERLIAVPKHVIKQKHNKKVLEGNSKFPIA